MSDVTAFSVPQEAHVQPPATVAATGSEVGDGEAGACRSGLPGGTGGRVGPFGAEGGATGPAAAGCGPAGCSNWSSVGRAGEDADPNPWKHWPHHSAPPGLAAPQEGHITLSVISPSG